MYTPADVSDTAYARMLAIELRDRYNARSGLLPFTQYTKKNYYTNWHHKIVADVLTNVVSGLTPDPNLNKKNPPKNNPFCVLNPNAHKRVIIIMPPRNGKSELASRRLPAFALGHNSNLQIIACSFGDDLATLINRDVQRIMTDRLYGNVFTKVRLNEKNIRTTAQNQYLRNSTIFQIVGYDGQYLSAGVGGPIGGQGANLAIFDDPYKNRQDADSDKVREAVWRFYTSTFSERFEDNAACVIMSTKWHDDDIIGRLLALQHSNPKAEKWHLVWFPALYEGPVKEEDDPDYAKAQAQYEQRTVLRTPLWPVKFDLATLEAKEARDGDDFQALQQGRPVKPGGRMFPSTNWKLIDEFIPMPDMTFSRGWDKGGTEGAGAFTAGGLMCFDPQRRYGVGYIVIDLVRAQYEEHAREKMIRDTAIIDRRRYGDVHYELEQEPGSGGKDQALNTIRQTLAGFDVTKRVAAGEGKKEIRWKPLSAQLRANNVGMVLFDDEYGGSAALIKRLAKLPAGTYKDDADALALAFISLTLGWEVTETVVYEDYVDISPF